jgi:streptogramin lyase
MDRLDGSMTVSSRAALALLLLAFALPALAHPPWGIVTNAAGDVYFSDLINVWRIDHRTGALTLAHRGTEDVHIHEISPDPARGFAAGPPRGFSVEQDNHRKQETLIRKNGKVFAGGAYGFADGTGTRARFRNIIGVTAGPGGDLYVVDEDAVRRITPAGVVTTIARDLAASDPRAREPFSFGALFGLDVTPSGTVYAADFRNRRVLRIAPSGAVTVALRADPPWTPTGVAVARNGEVYVMEVGFRPPSTWMKPRVRKLSNGRVTTVATVR